MSGEHSALQLQDSILKVGKDAVCMWHYLCTRTVVYAIFAILGWILRTDDVLIYRVVHYMTDYIADRQECCLAKYSLFRMGNH